MQIPKDSTDITTYFVLRDSATHAPKTDVTVTDIDLYYVSHKTAISSKADATALDAANSAHADNKAFNVGQGIYRIDWPDVWTGAVGTTVNLAVVCSGVDTEYLECEIVGVGQTGDVYPVVAKEATLATVAGYLDTEIADIKAKTDLIPASPAAVGSAMTLTSDYPLKTDLATKEDIQDGLATPTNITVATGIQLSATQSEYAPAKAGDKMDVIDAPNATAVTAIQSGLATSAAQTTINNNILAVPAAVWAVTTRTLSSFGTLVADIWNYLTSAITTTGSIGKLLTDNIDAPISEAGGGSGLDAAGVRAAVGLSTANLDTQLSTINSNVDAILVDTSTTIPALINADSGAGAISWTYTLTDSDDGTPIDGVEVWVTTDAAGVNVIASGYTNSSGIVIFMLDAGIYYFWRKRSGYNFVNPDQETVSV